MLWGWREACLAKQVRGCTHTHTHTHNHGMHATTHAHSSLQSPCSQPCSQPYTHAFKRTQQACACMCASRVLYVPTYHLCLPLQDKLARVAMVRDHMGLFCQRRMLRVWQDHVHATHHKAQLQAWASHRMAKHRLRTCLHALAAYTQHRVARKQKSHLAQRHYQARLQACVMSEWLGFVARFQWHERQLRRARAKADWGLKRRVLWGWREALLEAVREALTEQVYDLKRELAHAIAWSD